VLKSVNYTVEFASTNRVLHEEIKFQRGMGAIVGPNESGKSMVLEMVRWLLFGSAALRGTASDYTKVHGALEFNIRGRSYSLTRSGSGANLRRGSDEDIATGTKPVNAKVVELLGFGLGVFDIACAANQNALLALGQMRPTERKRIVDSVIGLGVIEDLAKSAGEEDNQLKRSYEDISSALVEPVRPPEPEGYVLSTTLKQEMDTALVLRSEFDRLTGWLSQEKKKVEVPSTTVPLGSDELQEFVDNQNADRARLKELEAVQKPRYTREELVLMSKQNLGYENKRRLAGLESRLIHLEKEQLKCPACGHAWTEDEKTILGVRKEIESLKQENIFSDKASDLPDHFIEREVSKLQAYNPDVEVEREQVRNRLERAPDYRTMLIERLKYEAALATYEKEVESYDEWYSKWKDNHRRYNELEILLSGFESIQLRYNDARDYESQLRFYNTAFDQYQSRREVAEGIKKRSEDWTKARVALSTVRSKVKQHLMPSLNRVASHLLKEMTDGQRQTIAIDEEFEILVDGQPLHTLSGSGMAVANLAIRIGLGQVLTNGVFSVFMADEIDASMDATRANATANSLQNLRNTISQILLVTHKSPTADYYITLGELNEPEPNP